jgi:hypothetical protein
MVEGMRESMKNNLKYSILLLFCIFTSGCVDLPNEIIPPQWDVDLNVPVINRSYLMSDIIDENENIYSGPLDSIYIIESDDYNVSSGIADKIEITSESSLNDVVVDARSDTQRILFLFPENIELDSAVFSSGTIHYNVYNPTSETIYLSLRIPGITKDGIVLQLERFVYPFSYDSASHDLTGYKYNFPSGQHSSLKRFLLIHPSITSPNVDDSLICNFRNTNFQFSSITGKISRRNLGNFNETFELKLGDALKYRDKIYLKEASLDLMMDYDSYYNSIFKAGLSDIQILGRRNTGETMALYMRDGSQIDIMLQTQKSEVIFNEINSNINEFLTFLPDVIDIIAEHIINPDNENVTFTATNKDSVKYEVMFRTRGYLALRNTTITDTLGMEIGESDRESILNSKRADINIEFENAIPLTASFKVILTDSNFNPLFTITRNSLGEDSILISGGEIDSFTGDVIAPASSFHRLALNSDETSKLANSYYAIVATTIKTKEASDNISSLTMVPIKVSNWVNIKAYGTIKYHVDPND